MAGSSLIFISTLLVFAASEYLPPKFETCIPSDSKCLKAQAQNMAPLLAAGIPEIGSKILDPVSVNKVSFSLAGLNMNFTDGKVYGLSKAHIENVKLDTQKKILDIAYYSDVILDGKYSANGRLIVLPITGDGDFHADLKHLNVKLIVPYDISKGADGKDYIKLKSFKIKFSIKGNENARYRLTNLFNGNKQLASALETFINENGELLTNELGGPILEAVIKVVYKQMKKFFDANPYENLVKSN